MSFGSMSQVPWGYNAGQYVGDYKNLMLGPPSVGELFFFSRSKGSVNYQGGYMGPTGSFRDSIVEANTWTLVRMHYDTRAGVNWKHEVWLRPQGRDWAKVSEYEAGKSPSRLKWPEKTSRNPEKLIPGGHSIFRLPTTWGDAGANMDRTFDIWIYLDDFAMAEKKSDLPRYD